jgi:hypothetical protein
MKISQAFADSCREWYQHRRHPFCTHNHEGRAAGYIYLLHRYGEKRVMRHLPELKAAFDAIEMRVKEEAQK